MRETLALAGLLALATSGSHGQVPGGLRPYEATHLETAQGLKLLVNDSMPYQGAVWVQAVEGDGHRLAEENVPGTFGPIESPEMARELCELLNWGSLVESERDYQLITDVFREAGYPVHSPEEMPDFTPVVKRIDGGYEVQFSAFVVVPHRMAPRACVQRFHYTVSDDARVKPVSRTTILPGPLLAWQTLSLAPPIESDVQAERELRAQKDAVLKGVHERAAVLLPRGRSRAAGEGAQ